MVFQPIRTELDVLQERERYLYHRLNDLKVEIARVQTELSENTLRQTEILNKSLVCANCGRDMKYHGPSANCY